jgi:hypothetical protein
LLNPEPARAYAVASATEQQSRTVTPQTADSEKAVVGEKKAEQAATKRPVNKKKKN